MRTANFPTIGTLPLDLPDVEDPLYQSASLSLTLHQIIKDMSDEGFVLTQAQSSDFTSFGNDSDDAVDDYIERYDELLRTGTSEIVAALPDVVPIIGALLAGGSGAVVPILLKGVLDTIVRHTDTRTDVADGEPSTQDFSAIISELEALNEKLETTATVNISDTLDTLLIELKEQIAVTLNEFTINLASDPLGQSWTVEPSGE